MSKYFMNGRNNTASLIVKLLFPALTLALGDVIHLKVLGRSIIVLNSVQAATDLLEKRSAQYSDRPSMNVYLG